RRKRTGRARSRCRPTSGPGRGCARPRSAPWTARAQDRARAPARSGRVPRSLVARLPVALLLERVGDLARHVIFVVLGENGIRLEDAGAVKRTLGNNPLPFPEQIGQRTRIGDRDVLVAVGHREAHGEIGTADETARLHQTAQADAGAGSNVLLRYVARRVEEDD